MALVQSEGESHSQITRRTELEEKPFEVPKTTITEAKRKLNKKMLHVYRTPEGIVKSIPGYKEFKFISDFEEPLLQELNRTGSLETNPPKNYRDLLCLARQSEYPPRTILLQGEDSLIKTWLLFKMAQDWAKDENSPLRNSEYLFIYNLGELPENEDLEDVLKGELYKLITRVLGDPKITEDIFWKIILGRTLILLDGFDDGEPNHKTVRKCLSSGSLFRTTNFIVTSKYINDLSFLRLFLKNFKIYPNLSRTVPQVSKKKHVSGPQPLTCDLLLEKMIEKGQEEFFPEFRELTMRFIEAFNHPKVQARITNYFDDIDKQLDVIEAAKTLENLILSLQNLLDFVKDKFTPMKLLERLQVSGLFALINDKCFKFLNLNYSEDQRVTILLELLDEEGKENTSSNIKQAVESFVQTWEANQNRLGVNETEINKTKEQMQEDQSKSEVLRNMEIERIIDDVSKHCEPVREKLVDMRNFEMRITPRAIATSVAGCAAAAILSFSSLSLLGLPIIMAVTFSTVSGQSKPNKYMLRSQNGWYDETINFCKEFLTHKKSKAELRHFLKKEQLEEEIIHIKKYINNWITDFRIIIRRPKTFLISKKVANAEIDRMTKFVYAAILNKPELLTEHNELVEKLIQSAVEEVNKEGNYLPLLSFGQLPIPGVTRKREVHFMLVLRSTQTQEALKSIMKELAIMFNTIKRWSSENTYGTSLLHLDVEVDENLAFLVSRNASKLAELNIGVVLIGSFGLAGFRHAMYPQLNRIYGKNEKAEGFIPYYFEGSQTRGGESYFCPNGWRCYAINVDKNASEFESSYGNWPVAYHGTVGSVSASILHTGLCASGEGCFLEWRRMHLSGSIWLSPSIEYSAHPKNAKVLKVWGKYVQMVLKVRVRKDLIFDKQPGEFPGTRSIDPNYSSNDHLRWLVKWPPGQTVDALGGILVYGMMLRVTDKHPKHLPQCAWWKQTRKIV